jgi:hypothetical protein
MRAAKQEHSFHLVEFCFLLVFLPYRVAVFANRIANLAEEETSRNSDLSGLEHAGASLRGHHP